MTRTALYLIVITKIHEMPVIKLASSLGIMLDIYDETITAIYRDNDATMRVKVYYYVPGTGQATPMDMNIVRVLSAATHRRVSVADEGTGEPNQTELRVLFDRAAEKHEWEEIEKEYLPF